MRDFKRQLQAFLHDPARGVMGDCYRTALACVLGVDRDLVPHTHADLTGQEHLDETGAWLHSQGLRRIVIPVHATTLEEVATIHTRSDGLPLIVTGCGPRHTNHVVVVYGPHDIWCPILGEVAPEVALLGPARPTDYFWAEWIVKKPGNIKIAAPAQTDEPELPL